VTTLLDSITEAAVAASAAQRHEPGWLVERRTEAARAFATLPLPTTRLRPWKYTDVSALDFGAFPPAELTVTIDGPAPGNGGARAATLESAQTALGVDFAEDAWARVVPATEGKFAAANAALSSQPIVVHAPRGAAPGTPIIIDLASHEAGPASVYPRLLIRLEEQAELTVVLRLTSGETPLLVAGVIEVQAAQASRLRLLIDERWGLATQDYTIVRSQIGRDADVQVATLAIGAHVLKQTVEAVLDAEGGVSTIRGVALGDGNQHFDFVTLADHVAPRTVSDVEIKAALAGSSRAIYYGVTRVGEGASGAEAMQENRNLLLSDNAKADSDPDLEILTADVAKCGHGATVGPVDSEALFYLESRGLDYRTALQLLVGGFFQSAIADIPFEDLAEKLAAVVEAKLSAAQLGSATGR
jgi:Fe-S cluster assembly protein SufD